MENAPPHRSPSLQRSPTMHRSASMQKPPSMHRTPSFNADARSVLSSTSTAAETLLPRAREAQYTPEPFILSSKQNHRRNDSMMFDDYFVRSYRNILLGRLYRLRILTFTSAAWTARARPSLQMAHAPTHSWELRSRTGITAAVCGWVDDNRMSVFETCQRP